MKSVFPIAICVIILLSSCSPSPVQRTATAVIAQQQTQTAAPTQIPIAEGMKDINGTRLYYKTIGTGEPIIFLHGSGGSHRYFLPFMEELADAHQLVFYDQRGTGLSDGQLRFSAITIDKFVDDLEALRVALGFEKVSLIGHSRGAIIALAYAIKYQPHLNKLILVDSIPLNNTFLVEYSKTYRQRFQSLGAEARQLFSTTCTQPLAKLTAKELVECNAIDAAIRFYDISKALPMDATIEENTAKNLDTIQSLLTTDFNHHQKDIDAKLATIHVPTLILHGDFDPIPIASSEYIQQSIPASKLVIITKSGHFPFVEQPEQFFKAIREFIQR